MKCPNCKQGTIEAYATMDRRVLFECSACIWKTNSITELFEEFVDELVDRLKGGN